MAEPLYYLGAAPKAQVQVPTLTREEGVRGFLENPPYARYSGWNLVTLERAELLPGLRLHIQNGQRKFLDLHEDGTFTAVATFDGFLGHGRWDFGQRPLVNGLAIVEFTYEFVSFYERLLDDFIEPLPQEVRFTVGVRNAHYDRDGQEQRLRLVPGPVGDFYDLGRQGRDAPQPSIDGSYETVVSNEAPHVDVERASYQLLRLLFNGFGLRDEAVPYTNDAHDGIDFQQIENIRR